MAKINVKNETVEMETRNVSPDYRIEVNFRNNETEEGYIQRVRINPSLYLEEVNPTSRSELTFDKVQKAIDNYFEEKDYEVEKVKSVRVKEIHTIKVGSNW